MSECGACQNYCGDCEEEIDRLRAELAEVYDHRDLLMDQRDAAEAAIARVRAICADGRIDERAVLNVRAAVLRALDSAE